LITIASGVDLGYQFLSSQRSGTAVIGVVAIDPPHHEAVSFLPVWIPILVVLSKSEAQLSQEDRQIHHLNASVIVVYSKAEVDRIEWEHLKKFDETGEENENKRSLYDPLWLWLARCIAKFAEAATRLDDDDDVVGSFRNDVMAKL
jgi:hypothetical protein